MLPLTGFNFQALREFAEVDIAAVTARQPGRNLFFGPRLPASEHVAGFDLTHPRYLSVPGLPGLNAASMFFFGQRKLGQKIKSGAYDVVLGAYAYPEGLGALLLAKQHGVPVVIKCHGSDLNRAPEHLTVRAQLRVLLPRAEGVVVVSEALGRTAEALGVSPAKIHTVYNGVDRTNFKPEKIQKAQAALGLSEKKKRVLFVGYLAEHKGVFDLVRAAELAESDAVEFLFVGQGPLEAYLRDHSLARAKTIKVLGRLSHDELADWIRACELLCLPSFSEGMPNVVREAHAAGRPVVATRVGGIPEAVHCPELGALVEPGEPEALWGAICQVLKTESETTPEARARLAEVPTWQDSAGRLAEVLRSVLRQ